MNRSEHINELVAALAKAQAKIEAAPKDNVAEVTSQRTGKSYKYAYSTLADVWAACRVQLAENGIAVIQPVVTDGPKVTITTLLAHASGQWIEESLTMVATDSLPQSIGSCITYGRRYGLGAMVGVVSEEDDDGAQAQGRPTTVTRKPNGNGAPAPQLSDEDRARIQEQTFVEMKERLERASTLDELHQAGKDVAAAHEKHLLSELQRLTLSPLYVAKDKAMKAAHPALTSKAQARQ